MTNLKLWKIASGLDLDDSFVDLPVSPHYWKPTTLSVSLLEGVKIVGGVSKGEYNGELEIDMSSLTQNKTYTVALEWYQKDAWLFNRSNFSAEGTGLEVNYLTFQKHTHEQNKTHLIYYHTLTVLQFCKQTTARLNKQLENPISLQYIHRNYHVVKQADIVLAFTCFKAEGNLCFGGTGWAVEMAKLLKKVLYVYDVQRHSWFWYNPGHFVFYTCDQMTEEQIAVPTLVP